MSSLPPIDPYVETYFWLSPAWKAAIPTEWVRRDTIVRWLTEQIMAALDSFGSEIARPYPALASNIFDRLLENGYVGTEKNPIAGTYYHLDVDALKKYRSTYLGNSEVHRQNTVIGHSLFEDVFAAYTHSSYPEENIQSVSGAPVPASDRIVTLTHNQVAEFSSPLSDLISQVEKTNGDPDRPGFRERIIGQLKAGRELLLAGTFRAYFLYTILVTALAELVAKHKGTAIAATAEALLGLLVQKLFDA